MYKEKFEIYDWLRDFESNDAKTIQRNNQISKRVEYRLAGMLADFGKVAKQFYKPETLESLYKRLESKDLYDRMVLLDHIQKTHSLDLKIKQLEERIEHLESK